MFCSKCGCPCSEDALFCHKCGTELATKKSASGTSVASPDVPILEPVKVNLPRAENILHAWRKITGLIARYKERPTIDIEGWIGLSVDIIFTDELMIIVGAPTPTSLKRIGDRLGSNVAGVAFALGPIGGAAALATDVLGRAFERVHGQQNSFDQESLDRLFASGLLVYARKADLRFRTYELRKPIFYKYDEVLVSGTFYHTEGGLEICFIISDERPFNEVVVQRGFSVARCLLEDHGKSDIYAISDILNSEYPWVYQEGSTGGKWVSLREKDNGIKTKA